MLKLAILLFVVCACAAERLPLIIGGKDVSPPGKYPWQASLQVYGQHNCGASLIGSTWIVTAAHCVGMPTSYLTVVLGMHDMNKRYGSPKTYKVKNIIKHSGYNGQALINDIALIQLTQTVTYNSYVRTIQMDYSSTQFPAGYDCVITGWGYTRTKPNVTPTNLQEAPTKIISTQECRNYFRQVGSGHVCLRTGYTGGCMGDSGGPLACYKNGWYLVGLTSFGRSDCHPSSPSVYTRISYYRNWVKQFTGI